MNDDYRSLLMGAFERYLAEVDGENITPAGNYLPYNHEGIELNEISFPGNFIIMDDLRETTNKINRWQYMLVRWNAWNNVIKAYPENSAMELQMEFLSDIAHHCLLMPSSIRDTFTSVATSSVHQVRLATAEEGYKDRLEGDPLNPEEISKNVRKHMTQKKKEDRLNRVVKPFVHGDFFMAALRKINNKDYRDRTKDYRNLNTHTIGPRLGFGSAKMVTRSVVQAENMVECPDGRILWEAVPGKLTVRYSFGDLPPLDLEDARLANLEQHQYAVECFWKYIAVLTEGFAKIPKNITTSS